jgi:hypothetical protein
MTTFLRLYRTTFLRASLPPLFYHSHPHTPSPITVARSSPADSAGEFFMERILIVVSLMALTTFFPVPNGALAASAAPASEASMSTDDKMPGLHDFDFLQT